MLMLKITICLLILSIVMFFIIRIEGNSLSITDHLLKNYPKYMIVSAYIWALLTLGFIGCLIATIILW